MIKYGVNKKVCSARLEKILRNFCMRTPSDSPGVNIMNAEVYEDHVHMLIEKPSKMSVSSFMGYLKGKSGLMIYEQWGNEIQISQQRILAPRILC